MVRIGLPLNAPLLCTDALAWTVAAERAGRLAIDFHQHGVVNIGTEGIPLPFPDRPCDRRWSVGPYWPAALCGIAVARGDQPGRNQLGVCVDRGPGPDITGLRGRGLGASHVLLLGIDVHPGDHPPDRRQQEHRHEAAGRRGRGILRLPEPDAAQPSLQARICVSMSSKGIIIH